MVEPGGKVMEISGTLPVMKSEKQKTLEKQGCVFIGQELLDNHEIDPSKDCYCGRPLANKGEINGQQRNSGTTPQI